jgi:hypothetical protein
VCTALLKAGLGQASIYVRTAPGRSTSRPAVAAEEREADPSELVSLGVGKTGLGWRLGL